MESCFLPIELCENIMDVLSVYIESPDGGWSKWPRYAGGSQRALRACALTCRAWRARAQYLLWSFPSLFHRRQLARFKRAVRESPNIALIRGLVLLNSDLNDDKTPDLRTAGELFMHSFPYMEYFMCAGIDFNLGPPLQVLRMRPPFFSSITSLALFGCTFQSLRAMLDVVWACSNLATLAIGVNVIKSKRCSAAGFQNLCTAAENLRACRKLTRLNLDADTWKQFWNPANSGLSGVGRVFGYAVTELVFQTACAPEVFISFIRDSFPALRSVTVAFGWFDKNRELPSWLHVVLATGRPVPGILKTIVLECSHWWEGHSCCKLAVGTSEDRVFAGSAQRLPEIVPELAELVLRLRCKHPARHAAYIWDVLPAFRNVLRFEYRKRWNDAWKPYTVLPRDVPRLSAQDTNSDSDPDSDSDSDS